MILSQRHETVTRRSVALVPGHQRARVPVDARQRQHPLPGALAASPQPENYLLGASELTRFSVVFAQSANPGIWTFHGFDSSERSPRDDS